jgi:hypothetical protein
MTLAGRWAHSRLQIELVIVENVRITESSKEPSTEYVHKTRADERADMKLLDLLCVAGPVFGC